MQRYKLLKKHLSFYMRFILNFIASMKKKTKKEKWTQKEYKIRIKSFHFMYV